MKVFLRAEVYKMLAIQAPLKRSTRDLSWKIYLWMMTVLKATYRIGTENTNDFVNDKTVIMYK